MSINCPSCNTLNPVQANYCLNCGREIKVKTSSGFTFDIPDEIAKIHSWGYKIVKSLPMPYWVSLILIWQIILCGDYFITNYFGVDNLLLFNFFLYGSFALVTIVVEFCNREMQRFYPRLETFVSEPQEKIQNWYAKGLNNSYGSMGSFICGLVLSILGMITLYDLAFQQSQNIPELSWYRLIFTAVGFFFLGTGIWAIFTVIRLINNLTDFRINVKLLAMGNESVMALGNLFLRMSLAISSVYVLIVIADVLAGVLTSIVILCWNGIAVISILMFFIVPQYKIHKIMSREKKVRIQSFSSYLEAKMNESLNEPSVERLQHLKELFELKEHLSGMNEWTFRSGAISQLISVLIIPLMLVLLEIYMSK